MAVFIRQNDYQFLSDLLAKTHRYVVKQKPEPLEMLFVEGNNRYEVYDDRQNLLFYAVEQTNCCSRFCFQSNRGYTITFTQGIEQPFLIMRAGVDCCGQKIDIECPTETAFGSIVKSFSLLRPEFRLRNYQCDDLYTVKMGWSGLLCKCRASDAEFPVVDAKKGQIVARILKRTKTAPDQSFGPFMDLDTFGVEFSRSPAWSVSPVHKTLILAAVFAVDFAFYEG